MHTKRLGPAAFPGCIGIQGQHSTLCNHLIWVFFCRMLRVLKGPKFLVHHGVTGSHLQVVLKTIVKIVGRHMPIDLCCCRRSG